MVNCPVCNQPASHGYWWRSASNIQEVCMYKQPGSERANRVETCHAKYNRDVFSEHPENEKSAFIAG